MRSARKFFRLNLVWITLFIFLFVLLPRISAAEPDNKNLRISDNQKFKTATIVVKDPHSHGLVLEKNGAFFYGVAHSRNIANLGQIIPNEFIAKYKISSGKQAQNSIDKTLFKYNARAKVLNGNVSLHLIQLPNNRNYFKIMRELNHNSNVEYVEPNYVVKAKFIPNDPYYSFQWGEQMIGVDSAWDKANLVKNATVIVAVLDTGVNDKHPDLKNVTIPGMDFADDKNSTDDRVGHGTHVAGIIAGRTNNGTGISGIANNCLIMPVKVLDDDGNGDDANIVKGIQYATDHGAQVINMSLGGPGASDALQDAINYAINHGVTVVVAAGNEDGAIDTPGNCQGVITVGAIDRNQQRASYSNFGTKLDVVAPGSDILSTYIDGKGPSGYTYFSGTSMATPFVSGVAAVIKSVNPKLSPAEVTDIIHRSATDLGAPGFDKYYGYGLINADKAVTLALSEIKTSRIS
ncbi:MAG TPA: peptidase S8 [Firmicutes bacterium]|jgi:thermitase|nr:peptidase S8 [Bacillota bacterium]